MLLKDLLVETRDGDWGVESPRPEHSPRYVIRGTDFAQARRRQVSGVPLRYLPDRNVGSRTLRPGDILLETAGGSRDQPTGRTLLITRDLLENFRGDAIGASFTRFLRADTNLVDPRYLYWYFQWIYRRGDTYEFQVQHTGIARFQYTVFASSREIPLPSLDSQRAIAEVLGALDDKIAANDRIIHLVDDLVEAHFELLAGGRGQVALAEIAVVNQSVTKPKSRGTLRYLDISSVGQGTYEFPSLLDWEEAPGRARRVLSFGDTVWSTVRPNRRSHALVLDDDPLLIASTGLAVLSPKAGRIAGLYEASRREAFVAYLEGVAEGSAYPAVRAERFRDAPVPDLSSEEWDGFETFALPMRKRAHAAAVESRHLAQTRDELLPLLMSGRVRVKDARKTLEEVL